MNDFVTFLRDSYGKTLPEQRQDLNEIRQQNGEGEIDFFARVERSYFMSKGLEKQTGANFKDWMKEDVMHQFRVGLRNNEIRRLLMLNSSTVEYKDLAKTAKNYEISLRDIEKVYSIKETRSSNRK